MVTKKIDKLTPEQEKDLAAFREEWLAVGLSTAPADFETAKSVITSFYKKLGKNTPKFHCLPSPRACADEIKKITKNNSSAYLSETLYGQHESYWISYYLFGERIGVKYNEDNLKTLKQWETLARSINWWTPLENDCLISDRPRMVKFDEERRLHCENDYAVKYSDGWGVCTWHGTRVPSKWIMDKNNLTAKTALTWQNVEQRRAACEILGWAKIVDELDAKIIDRDDDPEIGELLEVNIPDIGRERFLKVLCGTGRTFCLPVPPDMNTALQAQSWTWGLENVGDFLKPEIRT